MSLSAAYCVVRAKLVQLNKSQCIQCLGLFLACVPWRSMEYWRPTMACCVQVLVVGVYELGVIIFSCSLVGVATAQHVKTI